MLSAPRPLASEVRPIGLAQQLYPLQELAYTEVHPQLHLLRAARLGRPDGQAGRRERRGRHRARAHGLGDQGRVQQSPGQRVRAEHRSDPRGGVRLGSVCGHFSNTASRRTYQVEVITVLLSNSLSEHRLCILT